MHLREPGTQLQVANALAPVTEELDLDDVGYLYTPGGGVLCTVPGQLLGMMNNTRFAAYPFGIALRDTVSVLKTLDDDYSKLVVAITNYAKESDLYYAQQAIAEIGDISMIVYAIGKKWHPSLESLSKDIKFVQVVDAAELMKLLTN